MQLGYIGLGNMGGALARRMLETFPLRVFDLRGEAMAPFVEAGAIATQSPAALARECDAVLTCLPTSDHVREAIFGADGIAAGLAEGGVIADMTTGDPLATRAMAEELAERGLHLIDAPVSGGPHGATAGTIAIMVGASKELFERCLPAFHAVSPNVVHTGEVGTGHTTKLVNNMIAAGTRQVTFEGLSLAVKNGLDLETCLAVLQKGSAFNYTTNTTLPIYLKDPSKLTFTMGLLLKDVKLATQLGVESGVPMMLCNLAREMLSAGVTAFGPDADNLDILRFYERNAGVELIPDNDN